MLGEHSADAACDCAFRFPPHARSVASEFLLVEAGMMAANAADPAATPEPVACRIAAMLGIKVELWPSIV